MKPLAANSLLQNRYLIIHHIGKGGMGEVYLSVDQRLGNPVALKRTVFRDDAMMWDAFEREARILGRLRHSVLPKVTDHFSEKEEQYLVMDYISGDDLAKRLEIAKKPFPLQWVLYWADELLDALTYLHTHEPPIIHRDIKPQNLKLTSENHVVLLDFGLAKNSVAKKAHLSSSGSLVGYTPHYAPIEQIRGTGTGERSDIYSLSATLYQLLTGTVPVDALTRAESVIGGSGDSLPSPSEIIPEISNGISAVILRGMALNSEQRYPDAKEMQKALREAYAIHQQQAPQQTENESFDGAETLVPETKAAAPLVSVSGSKASNEKETFIFSKDDVDNMFVAAQDGQEPPVTLTAAALDSNGAINQPAISEADFSATIPAEQWAEGETQGFSHDEIRRSTIDEDAFKQYGFDIEAARIAAESGERENSFNAPPFIEETAPVAPGPTETAFVPVPAVMPEVAIPDAAAEKNTPIRPVTKPLEPVKKSSSGLGIKLVGVAAVLCLLIAGVGAGGWYAVSNKLITIPGLSENAKQPPAEDSKPNSSEVKNSGNTDNGPSNTLGAEEKPLRSEVNTSEVNSELAVDPRANSGDKRSAQQPKTVQKTDTKPKTEKPKTPAKRGEILQ